MGHCWGAGTLRGSPKPLQATCCVSVVMGSPQEGPWAGGGHSTGQPECHIFLSFGCNCEAFMRLEPEQLWLASPTPRPGTPPSLLSTGHFSLWLLGFYKDFFPTLSERYADIGQFTSQIPVAAGTGPGPSSELHSGRPVGGKGMSSHLWLPGSCQQAVRVITRAQT